MSFFSEFNKVVRYIPIVRSIVDIVVGAVRGICDAINNPQTDLIQFEKDNSSAKTIFVDSEKSEKEYNNFISDIRKDKNV